MSKSKPARGVAYGILNPWGDLWTHHTFPHRDTAERYLANWWSGVPADKRPDLSKFQIVDVRVTVSLLAQPTSGGRTEGQVGPGKNNDLLPEPTPDARLTPATPGPEPSGQ